ncbi:MAG TPA: hypothetical protein VHM90_23065 [Phycisphaerae bacterium]|jgi:hypothetical protein|nr:hypothetical protein [Phycisphaerae bacterium]
MNAATAVFVAYSLKGLADHLIVERIQTSPDQCRRTLFVVPAARGGWKEREIYSGPSKGLLRLKKEKTEGMEIPGDFASDNFAGLALASEVPHRCYED